jgi:hypothetical protein
LNEEKCIEIKNEIKDNTFIHYHDWHAEKFNFKKIKKLFNINFSFCFIRNPIDIFYSSFYWCKDEEAIKNFEFETNNHKISVNINDVNTPHDLIDILNKHEGAIIKEKHFINKIFLNNDFNDYNIIFDYKYYESSINFLIKEFKWNKEPRINNYKDISVSYGKSQLIDKNYKFEFLNSFFSPSINIYENLKNIICKPI